jgi:anaerobic dimethyl sulfoxide reductase subunit C (anchor subunit)
MEIQWQLVVFTLLVCLGSGTFATCGLLAIFGKDAEIRLPALVVSLAAMVVGGFASLFHVQHWERMFNGFGHLASGITQEIIGLALVCIAIVVYFVVSRKGKTPKWAGWMAIIVSIIMIIAMAHSYIMPSRPLWDSPLLYVYYFANFILLGGLTITLLCGLKGADAKLASMVALAGGALQVVGAIGYAVFIPSLASKFSIVEFYFDPNTPTKQMLDPNAIFSGYLTGDGVLLFWVGALIVGAIIPLVVAFLARQKAGMTLVGFASAAGVCAIAGGLAFRAVLYVLGFSLFIFY